MPTPIDISYLTAMPDINLEPLDRPPTYNYTKRAAPMAPMESVHNHYYTQGTPWYRKKWFCYSAAFFIAFVVVAVAVVLGVLLKLESIKREQGHSVSVLTLTTTLNSTSASLSSTESSTRRTRSTSAKPAPTQPPLVLSRDTQLASTYSHSRRLLALQDSHGDLVVIEWWANRSRRYLLRDRVASLAPARDGTPLAMQDDASGAVHLFYLTPSNVLTHVYLSQGRWAAGDMTTDKGAIRTSATAMLSASWHGNPGLLAVAFDDPTQQLQLALSDSSAGAAGSAAWFTADVTPLDVQQKTGGGAPCYSLAGREFVQSGRAALLLALVVADEVDSWQCVVDSWPPPRAKVKCFPTSGTFQDADGARLTMTPPPQRMAWIQGDDLTLLCLRRDGIVESVISRGKRRTGLGVEVEGMTALATDSDGLLFVSDGAAVVAYRKNGQSWAVDQSVKGF